MHIEATKRPDMTVIGRCKVCKSGHRKVMVPVFVRKAEFDNAGHQSFQDIKGGVHRCVHSAFSDGCFITCECGGRVHLKVLHGKHNASKGCSARCMSATGPNCECSCAGANHGANHG